MRKKKLEYHYVGEPDQPKMDANVYVINRKRRETSFADYLKMGIGLYIGYTLAEKYVPMIKDKLKKN